MKITNILYPTDFSPCAQLAFRHAVAVARSCGARLHLFHVVALSSDLPYDPMFYVPAAEEAYERAQREALTALELLGSSPQAADVETILAVRRNADPGAAILEYASDNGIDLVVMGTHGRRGPARLVLGSLTEEVLRHSTCPVLTRRLGDPGEMLRGELPPREILLPWSFAPAARQALDATVELARRWGARLRLLHIVEEPLLVDLAGARVMADLATVRTHRIRLVELQLQEMVAALGPDVTATTEVRIGRPAHEILAAAAASPVDLIVMTSRVRGMRRLLFGSAAEQVLRLATVPLLIFNTAGEEQPAWNEEGEWAEPARPDAGEAQPTAAAITPAAIAAPEPALEVAAAASPKAADAPSTGSGRRSQMRVNDLMQHEPQVATPGMTLEMAGHLMDEVGCGFLPVVADGGVVVGVITDRDLCVSLTRHDRRPSTMEVRQVMSGDVWSCGVADSVNAAIHEMATHRVRRLPVLDSIGRLVGVLSLDDVLAEARPAGEGGHPSYARVAAALQSICGHGIPALR